MLRVLRFDCMGVSCKEEVLGDILKGLNSPTFTTQFKLQLPDKGLLPPRPLHSGRRKREQTQRAKSFLGCLENKASCQPSSESSWDLPKFVQMCPKTIRLNLSRLEIH